MYLSVHRVVPIRIVTWNLSCFLYALTYFHLTFDVLALVTIHDSRHDPAIGLNGESL